MDFGEQIKSIRKRENLGSITNFVGFRISDIIPPAHIEQL